ncbi:O-antigen ligase family protein [Kocuria sp. M4R2S49]|uniref:O-antigen ligase family protein n=1 Tax=Kocuria rhizosphaericola TaxID=3376284 RepID=UPI0037A09486
MSSNALWRLICFVGLGMFVMQAEAGISASLKYAYFPIVVLFAYISWRNIGLLDPRIRKAIAPAMWGIGVLSVFVIARAFISIFQGEEVVRVFRDSFTYVLICMAPLVGVDAGRDVALRTSKVIVVLFTGLAAVSFSVFWLSARGVSLLGVERIFMFSMILSGLGIMVGGVYGMIRLSPMWLIFGSFCLIAVLVTGTRSGLLLVLGLIGAYGALKHYRVPLVRLLVGLSVVVMTAYLTVPLIASQVSTQGFFEKRVEAILRVLEGGVSADASGSIRARALEITLDEWTNHPLLGVGFGHAFASPVAGRSPVDFQLDSGMLLFAKFGIIGTLFLLLFFVLLSWSLIRFHIVTGVRSEGQAIGTAFLFMCLVFAVLGAPTEDKGFAFGLGLVFHLLTSHTYSVLRARRTQRVEGTYAAHAYRVRSADL